jgi:xylulose-5-phosphate/fructose-6-phosphate phosphoketolase
MPAQLLQQPNPPPEPSHIPDVAFLASQRSENDYKLSEDDREAIRAFRRAADYLSAAMIFLNAKVNS